MSTPLSVESIYLISLPTKTDILDQLVGGGGKKDKGKQKDWMNIFKLISKTSAPFSAHTSMWVGRSTSISKTAELPQKKESYSDTEGAQIECLLVTWSCCSKAPSAPASPVHPELPIPFPGPTFIWGQGSVRELRMLLSYPAGKLFSCISWITFKYSVKNEVKFAKMHLRM